MIVEDLLNILNKLDPKATIFISEDGYSKPFRLTKILSLESGYGQIGTLNKDGDIVKKGEMQKAYKLTITKWSDRAINQFACVENILK